MKLSELFTSIVQGEKITRDVWITENGYRYLYRDKEMIMMISGGEFGYNEDNQPYILRSEDLLANDWRIY